MDLVELFCNIDDFCNLFFQDYSKYLLTGGDKKYFPNLVSYSRFVELKSKLIIPLIIFLKYNCSKVTGISYIRALA